MQLPSRPTQLCLAPALLVVCSLKGVPSCRANAEPILLAITPHLARVGLCQDLQNLAVPLLTAVQGLLQKLPPRPHLHKPAALRALGRRIRRNCMGLRPPKLAGWLHQYPKPDSSRQPMALGHNHNQPIHDYCACLHCSSPKPLPASQS